MKARTFSVVVGVGAALLAGVPARAQEPTTSPSPKELWQAYLLAPEDAPATSTPSVAATEGASSVTARPSTPTPTPTVAGDDGGIPLAVPIGAVALAALGVGIGLGRRRRSEPVESVSAPAGRERIGSESAPSAARVAKCRSVTRQHVVPPDRPAKPGGAGPKPVTPPLNAAVKPSARLASADPKRLARRDYPVPARPAPPAPPPPPTAASSNVPIFKAAREEPGAAAHHGAKQKEPD